MWSLGVITYLMLSKVLPFDDDEDKEIAGAASKAKAAAEQEATLL